MQSSTSLTEQDYQYGINGLTLLMNKIKTPSSSIEPNIFMANAQTNSSLGTPDSNTAKGDTPAYWGVDVVKNKEGKPTTNNYKWIPGDTNNRLWSDVRAYTSRNNGQPIDYVKRNIDVQKMDLKDGKTQWKITFFKGPGIWTTYFGGYHSLENAQMGTYLTRDYRIIGDVNVHVSIAPETTYKYNGVNIQVRNSANDPNSGNVNPEYETSFAPGDVNLTNGVISNTMNPYYQFGRYADIWNMTPGNFDKSVFNGDDNKYSDKNKLDIHNGAIGGDAVFSCEFYKLKIINDTD